MGWGRERERDTERKTIALFIPNHVRKKKKKKKTVGERWGWGGGRQRHREGKATALLLFPVTYVTGKKRFMLSFPPRKEVMKMETLSHQATGMWGKKNPFLHPTPNRSSSHHKSHRTHHPAQHITSAACMPQSYHISTLTPPSAFHLAQKAAMNGGLMRQKPTN